MNWLQVIWRHFLSQTCLKTPACGGKLACFLVISARKMKRIMEESGQLLECKGQLPLPLCAISR